ncbi:MAG: hypothetical protein JEZ07_07220 [Phycisphaerae bacterium]|nr:hypothetical protein [Phycisphaerae bacterium]
MAKKAPAKKAPAKKAPAKKAPAKKAPAKKAPAKKAAPAKEALVVTSKVKAYIRSKGFMCSADAIGTINETVYKALDEALARCGANKRSTLRPQDL